MATQFTLASPKAVSFKGTWNVPGAYLSGGDPYYLLRDLGGTTFEILGTFIMPASGGGIYNNHLWITAVLPAGTYTIANDPSSIHICFGAAGGYNVQPDDFIVSA